MSIPIAESWNEVFSQIFLQNVFSICLFLENKLKTTLFCRTFLGPPETSWPDGWPHGFEVKICENECQKNRSLNPSGRTLFAKKRDQKLWLQIGHFWSLRPHLQSTPPIYGVLTVCYIRRKIAKQCARLGLSSRSIKFLEINIIQFVWTKTFVYGQNFIIIRNFIK